MSTADMEKSFASTRKVLANVKPDQMDDGTTCASWKVRNLVNHIVAGPQWFGDMVDTGTSQVNPNDVPDYSSMDYMKVYDDGVTKSLDAFGKPGALEKQVTLPFGQMPGGAFMGLATTDNFTHGWDLAKSTGQPTDLEPELAQRLLDASKANIQDAFRGDDGKAPFGPEVQCDDDAPAADRLAAFLGRQP